MSNNIQRAQQIISCFRKEHPNTCGCCCSGRQIPGPTGPTETYKSVILYFK